jgi:hypothetical protein
VIAERLASQQLSGPPAGSPEEVVERLLAVQAQDPRGARLAIRSRSEGLSAADVDAALTTRRSLVVTWLNRGTLHLVTREDYWWLHPLTAPRQLTSSARRLEQEGVSPAQAERGIEAVVEAVTSAGPQTRAQLRERLDAAGVLTGRSGDERERGRSQAFVHVLLAASLRGHVVRGPMRDGEQAYVAVREWLGEAPPPLERGEALARLARRYLAGHAPADAADLARWAGISLGDARRGLAAAGPSEPAPARPLPPPRLLGAFDPLLLGWTSREPVVGPHGRLVTSNGLFRPFALAGGRAVATWGLARGQVSISPLEPVEPATLAALEQDAGDVLRFLSGR